MLNNYNVSFQSMVVWDSTIHIRLQLQRS